MPHEGFHSNEPQTIELNAMSVKNASLNWLAHRLPPCKEITRMASDAMEHKLPLPQRIKMHLHFLTCRFCLRYFKQLQTLRTMAQQYDAHAEQAALSGSSALSPEARERFKVMLQDPPPSA